MLARYEPYRDALLEAQAWPAKGREGAVLVAPSHICGEVPLVRSTTQYERPHQLFRAAHVDLVAAIQDVAGGGACAPRTLNNVMVERYDWQYRTMRFHSDQAADLAEDSTICVFSCYNTGASTTDVRYLVCAPKTAVGSPARRDEVAIPLLHNSVVMFTTRWNARMVHKIVPRVPAPGDKATVWLGVTLRTSKRALTFDPVDGQPWLCRGVRLVLAEDEDTRAHVLARRRKENTVTTVFAEPDPGLSVVEYTLSRSDMVPPTAE